MIKFCFHTNSFSAPWFKARHLVVLGLLWSWLGAACYGADGQIRITNLAELNRVLETDQRLRASVEIVGTVWWSSKSEGRVILKDDTAVLQLELDLLGQMPCFGDRLILEGECTAMKTRDFIKVFGIPVVENGGLHPPVEKSGTIHLNAGRHPIRADWFNRTDRYGLKVSYEGPGIARQQVPDDVLFRSQVSAETGRTNFVHGLVYRCYEGPWWRFLPNFNHMAAVKKGVASHFDIEVRSRNNHVGLRFDGFIDVPRDGDYTFHVQSDDGSRLFIGESSLRIHSVPHETNPPPRPMGMEANSAEQPEFQWAEIQGTVTSFSRLQGALAIDLMTGTDLVRLNVAEDSDCSYTLRPQNRIRAVGVGRRVRNLDGSWILGDFFVQHWNDIEQHYITLGIWNEYPLVEIGNLMSVEPSNVVESVVHVNGRIESAGPGQPKMLDDGSGRIIVPGTVSNALLRSSVDLLGRVGLDGSNLVLRCPHFRQFGEVGPEANGLPLLTTAEEICHLSLEEAARNYPVRVRGVITSPNEYDGAILHDSSRGIYLSLVKPGDVDPDDWEPIAVQMGDYCEIEGVTAPYGFDPYILVSQLKKLGAGSLPEPVQPTWDQLINGSLHCNYVELEGVVTSIEDHTISLLTRDGRINVRLNPIGPKIPRDSLGATIRLRGSLLAEWDEESRQVVVGSIYLDQHNVSVVLPAPTDPFSTPLKHVGDLLQFDPQAGALQRVRVSGQLMYQDARVSYLADNEHGLRYVPAEGAISAQVGDRVDVVGFLDLNGLSPLLRDAVIRRLGTSELQQPRKLGVDELLNDEYDSTQVRLEGVLLGASGRGNGAVLEMQSGLRRFVAVVDDPIDVDKLPEPGSTLELTGVYVGLGGNRVLGHPIDGFQLLIDSHRDIITLTRPPWWTPQRMLIVVGLLFVVLLASFGWINLLHHKVEQRTQQLGDQIRQRQRAERQREIEQERARVAHDLHDDLGAGLTEVNMLASLLKSPATSAEEKIRYADDMNGLALRMVTSLDEIVWAVNPRNDTVASLAGYFGSYAQRFLELASIGCGLDMAKDLPDQSLDPKFRQELFLAFKEALSNVVRHAEATKVWLRIFIEDHELVVIVSDDGCGILSGEREAGADGLVNMQERLGAFGGRCEIESDPAKGTKVRLQAPIQEAMI